MPATLQNLLLAPKDPAEILRIVESLPRCIGVLPIRREIGTRPNAPAKQAGQTKPHITESIILRHDLVTEPGWVLLRVKHVAIDFSRDFAHLPGTVPGCIAIGKLQNFPLDGPWLLRHKFLVFPHSRCLHEASYNSRHFQSSMCSNCLRVQEVPVDQRNTYSVHKKWPCISNPAFGRDLAGGLQDYMQIRLPQHSLVKISSHVSVHDCCFLVDIALPFYSFCQDTLCEKMATSPASRVLLLLNDASKEANDCLLVMHHLNLDHLRFTLSDVAALQQSRELIDRYSNQFSHVLVFSRLPRAFALGLQCAISTGLASSRSCHTLTVFTDLALPAMCHQENPDKCILRVQLSYKDKYLFERLLKFVGDLNCGQSESWKDPRGCPNLTQDSQVPTHGGQKPAKSWPRPTQGDRPNQERKTLLVVTCAEDSTCPATEPATSATPASFEDTASITDSTMNAKKAENPNSTEKANTPKTAAFTDSVVTLNLVATKGPRFQIQTELTNSIALRKNLRWLHCDHDFGLCLDHLVFDEPEDCHLCHTINRMLGRGWNARRVFYTHRPRHHSNINALDFFLLFPGPM